jgi:hypothetical protein
MDRLMTMNTIPSLEEKETSMRVYGQVTVWRTPGGGGAPRDGRTWWRALRRWWAARHYTHQHAAVAAFDASWNPQRETFQPRLIGSAADVAAAQGTLSTATRLYACSL